MAVADVTIDRAVTPHDQDERCATHAHCVSCQVDELDRPGDYRVCGECGHIFRTEQDLITAEKALLLSFARFYPEGPQRDRALQGHVSGAAVMSCPLCTHDF